MIPPRRWPRRILLALNIFTLLCLVSAGSVYAYAQLRLGQIKVISSLPFHHTSGDSALSPMNILLVGNNSRVGLDPSEAAQFGTAADAGGAHSDVTMILHLNPKTGAASLLSIPRDMFVPLPPNNISGTVGKIDSALNGSNYQYTDGAAQLIETIQNDLGINIDHYVEINFDGFQKTVDALGGINMYFPTLLYDLESNLRNPRVGCLHLNGQEALAVVRSRHLQYFVQGDNINRPQSWPQENESDLARIQRDHTFLKVLASSVVSQGITANLFKANDVLSSLISQVTIDAQLKPDLLTLAKRFRSVNLGSVPELTLPITVVPDAQYFYKGGAYGTVDFPSQPVDAQVIAQWQQASFPKVDPSSFSVQVDNISSIAHEAATTVDGLNLQGFHATDNGQGNIPSDNVETMIRYNPNGNGQAQAETVLQSLSGSIMMKADPSVSSGVIELDTGTSMSVVSPSTTSSTTAPPSTSASSSGSTAATSAVPTPGNQPVSSSTDQLSPWDPIACSPGQPVFSG
ncbi:MAG: LCP family protein [Acidimicrobiales bacterium]